jgi:hypothetical protein
LADYATILTGGSNLYQTTAEHLNYTATDFMSDGVVGTVANTAGVAPMTGGLAVNAQGSPNMTVAVTTGVAYVTATPTGQASQRLRAKIAAQNAAIAANVTGATRYDWIYVTISATNANTPNAAGDNVASITVSRSTSSTVDNGTPPTYGYHIATVTVANSASSITNGNITDTRSTASISAVASSSWTTGLAAPTTVTYNGNRNYSLVFNSVDYTSVLSNGMRLRLARAVTAPTQCTDLESGSTQWYSRASASINGMSFVDDFVVSAWVKLESYTGTQTGIATRYNGTNGWLLMVESTGQVSLRGVNAAGGNYSQVTSSASLPLGRWVHVAAQLDMSAFTATTTTSYVMFDGLDVAATVTRAGTNPTTLIQAGNLEIGAFNGGAAGTYFDGKLAQVAIYNAKVTQATIAASISQGLSGSETSLISAYSFNGVVTDLNANGNTLTPQGSAVATNVDSPFAGGANASTAYTAGTTDFGEVFNVSFSTNTTVVVQVPDGYAIPTSGGVSAVSYSTAQNPLGWTDSKVIGYVPLCTNATTTSASAALVSGLTTTAYVPAGRKVKVTFFTQEFYNSGGTNLNEISVWSGTVGSGTQICALENNNATASNGIPGTAIAVISPLTGSNTFNVGMKASAGTSTLVGQTLSPAFISVELV